MSAAEVSLEQADVDEVLSFINDTLGPVVTGQPKILVLSSFLYLLISQMGPEDMTHEEVVQGVQETSGFMSMYLGTLRSETAH